MTSPLPACGPRTRPEGERHGFPAGTRGGLRPTRGPGGALSRLPGSLAILVSRAHQSAEPSDGIEPSTPPYDEVSAVGWESPRAAYHLVFPASTRLPRLFHLVLEAPSSTLTTP